MAMMEPAGPGEANLRAFLRVGGAPLARHQLTIALRLGCQRIICIAREITPEMIALQHEAEAAGARFHVITGARGLPALVTANDELLVLSEGLLAEPQQALALLEGGQAVLVQPVESGVMAGFERIDLNHAAAGAMRIPGRLAERLSELAPDCDVPSALTRIALQAGVATHEVPPAAREGVRWRLVRSEEEAQRAEDEWIRLHIGDRAAYAPARLAARLGVLAFGPALLHAGAGSRIAAVATLVALVLGLVAGWLGSVVVGFVLCAVAGILRQGAGMLARIEAGGRGEAPARWQTETLGWLLDGVLVLLVAWRSPLMPWDSWAERAFAPIVLLLLIRLVARLASGRWVHWLADRSALALVLMAAALAGPLSEVVQALALLVAVAGLGLPGRKVQITRT